MKLHPNRGNRLQGQTLQGTGSAQGGFVVPSGFWCSSKFFQRILPWQSGHSTERIGQSWQQNQHGGKPTAATCPEATGCLNSLKPTKKYGFSPSLPRWRNQNPESRDVNINFWFKHDTSFGTLWAPASHVASKLSLASIGQLTTNSSIGGSDCTRL